TVVADLAWTGGRRGGAHGGAQGAGLLCVADKGFLRIGRTPTLWIGADRRWHARARLPRAVAGLAEQVARALAADVLHAVQALAVGILSARLSERPAGRAVGGIGDNAQVAVLVPRFVDGADQEVVGHAQ